MKAFARVRRAWKRYIAFSTSVDEETARLRALWEKAANAANKML